MDAPSHAPRTADIEQAADAPRGLLRELRWMAIIVIAMLMLQVVVIKPFYIPSVSMMPTLITGDRLIASKYPYGWSWASVVPRIIPRRPGRIMNALPERGDIVTAVPPRQNTDYIKRVIGLPGDTIQVRKGRLAINGREVERHAAGTTDIPVDQNVTCREGEQIRFRVRTTSGYRCRLPIVRETLPNGRTYDTLDLGYQPMLDDYGPIVVPAGHVFLMGDNRDQSADSRIDSAHLGLGGPVPLENIGGRAEFISFSMSGYWWPPFRSGRTGTTLRPAQERR